MVCQSPRVPRLVNVMNRRWAAATRALAAAVVLGGVLTARDANAQMSERTRLSVDRLHYTPPAANSSDDPRPRINAALALGASGDDEAVTPLCQALSDPDATVRQTVAVALKRLSKPSAVGCLRARADREPNAAVKLQISRALEALDTGGGGGGGGTGGGAVRSSAWTPKLVPNAKYYVATSTITNNTKRALPEVEGVVLNRIRTGLESLGTMQIAPVKESADAARAIMRQRKMKGLYLALAVEHDYQRNGAGYTLRVRVKCAVFSYPGKDLRGELPANLAVDVSKMGDAQMEDMLMEKGAEKIAQLLNENATAF